ncbi:MAG: type II secretion system secretin GspD, partial [Alphaproteobacteria bacterium]|nr:type II secretion system secretin GspD [Alphaproteobacteria bacterium]
AEQPPATDAEQPDGAAAGPTDLTPEQRYEIFKGKGSAVGRPRRSKALATVAEGGDITLNFVDADIREVMKATLGGILGVNYTVSAEIQGLVTVQSGRPVPREALLPTLETILRMHGVALVREGPLYRVQPLQGAARGNAAIRLGMSGATEGEAYGIQVVPLYFVSAAQMAETLRPIAREGGVLHVDETRNVIMLGGTRFELAALLEAVEIFDVNWLSGMSFGLFSLEYADARALADELNAILGDGKRGVAGGLVRLVPVERLNAVLAVSRQHRYIQQVRQWVERLDKPGGGGSGGDQQLYIYFVQNGKAGNLADVLNDVFANQGRQRISAARQEPGGLAPGLEPVEIGDAQAQPAGDVQGEQQAQPQPAPPAATPQPSSRGIALSSGGQIRVVADKERNALLISGTQGEYRSVLRALKQLDRRPLEVLIEVTIADVTLTDRLEYGIRWFFQSGNHGVTLSDIADPPGAVASTFPGLSYVYSVTNARAVLDLLSSITDVEVISAPQLLVLNNQEAQLQVGAQVPVATQQSTTVDPDPLIADRIVSTIELKDTGVILKVTPRVNDSGLIIIEIEQEVSQVSQDAAAGTLTPTISKRIITTTAAVQSGQTVALGGLIQDNKTNTKVGIPGLSAIPFLGALFRYTT